MCSTPLCENTNSLVPSLRYLAAIFLAVPTAGEHAFAVLAVGENVAIDLEPHGFVGRGFVGVDVKEQFGSLGLGRGDVEFDFCAESGREFFADVAVNAHFVGEHISGGEAGGRGWFGASMKRSRR